MRYSSRILRHQVTGGRTSFFRLALLSAGSFALFAAMPPSAFSQEIEASSKAIGYPARLSDQGAPLGVPASPYRQRYDARALQAVEDAGQTSRKIEYPISRERVRELMGDAAADYALTPDALGQLEPAAPAPEAGTVQIKELEGTTSNAPTEPPTVELPDIALPDVPAIVKDTPDEVLLELPELPEQADVPSPAAVAPATPPPVALPAPASIPAEEPAVLPPAADVAPVSESPDATSVSPSLPSAPTLVIELPSSTPVPAPKTSKLDVPPELQAGETPSLPEPATSKQEGMFGELLSDLEADKPQTKPSSETQVVAPHVPPVVEPGPVVALPAPPPERYADRLPKEIEQARDALREEKLPMQKTRISPSPEVVAPTPKPPVLTVKPPITKPLAPAVAKKVIVQPPAPTPAPVVISEPVIAAETKVPEPAPAPAPAPKVVMPSPSLMPEDVAPVVNTVSPDSSGEILSSQTRHIADTLPRDLEPVPKSKRPRKVKLSHGSSASAASSKPVVKKHESLGIKIELKTPPRDISQELEKAYEALLAGYPQTAIDIYQGILDRHPKHRLAMFGMATTYHKMNDLATARDWYGRLLAVDPHHRDALNNFFVLMSEESPAEALSKLKQLESDNPTFSPIPAQIAVLHQQLGDNAMAAQAMARAVRLSPENLVYRYNLAILLDRVGNRKEAADLYRGLLEASHRGAKLPGSMHEIQDRLTFIMANPAG